MEEQMLNDPQEVIITAGSVHLDGILTVPKNAKSIVLFVHGSGSSHLSKRNQLVAKQLNDANIATLLFDLLTVAEEEEDERTLEFRFDIEFLAERLKNTLQWVKTTPMTENLAVGLFGASTGGAAALVIAAEEPRIKAIVSRGGRPDLAFDALAKVTAPVLFIVGGNDLPVIKMNEDAMLKLHHTKKLEIIPGATHLFDEPGTLDEVARLAKDWFLQYL
jgi:dienelactone hydrolase